MASPAQAAGGERSHGLPQERISGRDDPPDLVPGRAVIGSRVAPATAPLGVAASISKQPDPLADINHHIIYYDYDGRKTTTDTVMVTHIA